MPRADVLLLVSVLPLAACDGCGRDRPALPAEARACADDMPWDGGCWRWLPTATFLQGAQADDPSAPGHDPAARPEEGPPREVTVSGFWIMANPVHRAAWEGCVAAGGCQPHHAALPELDAANDAWTAPASGIAWEGARDFCAWKGGALPTEAEWERAARGPEGRRFPWGEAPEDCVARKADDPALAARAALGHNTGCYDAELEATLHRPAPPGVLRLVGAVTQWTADTWDAEAYAAGPARDPRTEGPDHAPKAARGASWVEADPMAFRGAARAALPPDARLPDVGFRCVVR